MAMDILLSFKIVQWVETSRVAESISVIAV